MLHRLYWLCASLLSCAGHMRSQTFLHSGQYLLTSPGFLFTPQALLALCKSSFTLQCQLHDMLGTCYLLCGT